MPAVKTNPRSRSKRIGRTAPILNIGSQVISDNRNPESAGRLSSLLFAVLLFCSGAAALIYQVLWIKQLSLVVGAEIYSVTIALSAFFAGLAAGSAFFGRLADRLTRPLLAYAALECGIAILSVAMTDALARTPRLFAVLEMRIGTLAWILPFLMVGVPAFLMGGTLPIAIRAWSRARDGVSSLGGNAYAANAAGGVASALLTTFILLPALGVHGTAYAAAAFNLAAAAAGLRLSNLNQQTMSPPLSNPGSGSVHLALILYSLAGGIALGYEVVWTQAIVQFLSTRSFAFSIVLATYLTGLVLGSAVYARFADRVKEPWGVFGVLIAGAGLIAFVEIAGLSLWQLQAQAAIGDIVFAATGSEFAKMCGRFLAAALGIILLPTLLLGAAFPAALRLTAKERSVGQAVGVTLALNTVGGIAGTLITGFVLVPMLGLVHTLAVLAIGAAGVGAVAVLRGTAVRNEFKWAVLAIGLVAVVTGVLTPSNRLGRLLGSTRGGGTLIFYQESRGGTVAVLQQGAGDNSIRRLYIQGVSNSGDAMPSLRYMRLQALLPLLIHNGEPRSAMVIGFGTGITAGATLQFTQLKKRVCAELLPAVVQSGAVFRGNFDAGSDPRLQIRLRDGRRELARSSERYDLITLEPPPPSAVSVVNLYSRDFYALAASRLEANGLLAQWLPIATQNDGDTRSLVRSFLDVFPYASLWTTELHEMLLIGSLTPIQLNVARISERFHQPAATSALQDVGVNSPAALMATWIMGREGLSQYASDAAAVTDDHPRIEYATWVHPGEIRSVLPVLLALRSDPPLVGGDAAFVSEVQTERETLLSFYTAGLAAYSRDRELWGRAIKEVFRRDRNNPYYRWSIREDR
jgi:spermidine synthase